MHSFNPKSGLLLLFFIIQFSDPSGLCSSQISSCFSSGDFTDISVSRPKVPQNKDPPASQGDGKEEESSHDPVSGLFYCPNDGCVKMYQRHSSLENHLHYGKCELVPERESLFDKAIIMYRDKLLHGSGKLINL